MRTVIRSTRRGRSGALALTLGAPISRAARASGKNRDRDQDPSAGSWLTLDVERAAEQLHPLCAC